MIMWGSFIVAFVVAYIGFALLPLTFTNDTIGRAFWSILFAVGIAMIVSGLK